MSKKKKQFSLDLLISFMVYFLFLPLGNIKLEICFFNLNGNRTFPLAQKFLQLKHITLLQNNTSYHCALWYDDVACSGRCAYMLGLSVNSVILVEGTSFFIFSFHPSSFSTIFFYIYFLSSSSSSSFPILSLLSSYKFFCSLLLFLDFTFKSFLFILFFSLYLLLIPISFLLFFLFSLFFILTLLFLSLCFSFLRGFYNFLHIPSPWWTTNSVDKPFWLITFFFIFGLFY